MHNRPSFRPPPLIHFILALVLLGFGGASRAIAQVGYGTVEGVARTAEDGAPLSFLLIQLLPVDYQTASPLRVLTDGEGGFSFIRVPAGDYRLQVERIGYQRILSPVVSVQPGATLFQEIISSIEPIQLAEITVWPAGSCLTGGRLEEHPDLAALWNEAQTGVEIRRAFELQYRFVTNLQQDIHARQRLLRDKRQRRDTTLVNEPDSVLVRDQRRQASH